MDTSVILYVLYAIIPIFIMVILVKILELVKAKKVFNKYRNEQILLFSSNANFFGKKSSGFFKQLKGNGVLLLTNKELYFEKWISNNELRISLSSIKSVEKVKSFLGKTKFRTLLKVNFINKDKKADSCAWLVSEPDSWIEAINSHRKHRYKV